MSLTDLWAAYRAGQCSASTSLLLGAGAGAASLLGSFAVLRPLVRALCRKDTPKVVQSRLRRTGFAMAIASVALGSTVAGHAVWPPGVRDRTVWYEASELLLILFAGYVLLEVVLSFFGDFLPRVRGLAPVAPILKDLLRALGLICILLYGAKRAFPEVDIGALMTTSAILSVVVGLALQESLSNIFSGLMLTIDRPFKPGDWVEVDGKEGKVLDSNWRSTRILTRDDDIMYVPNSTMAKGNIVNLTDPTPEHLCRKRLGIEYAAPPNKVRNVLINVMSHTDGVIKDPPPDVHVLEYGDSAIFYDLRFWIVDFDRRIKIESELMRAIWYHLKREGISIPYPIRDVYLRKEKPAHHPDEIIRLLRRVDILGPLQEDEVSMLAEDLSHHLFGRGEAVCKQGDPGTTFYIIKTGQIGVRVKDPQGAEVEVARLGPGNYFGEMSLLTGDPRTSTCTALEDSELLCLDRDSFGVLLSENPLVAKSMSDILAARTQATQQRLTRERETVVQRPDDETGSRRILEKIWTIFRSRK